jgi:CO/xanthine dehydrogenase FAD-binding subunit
MRAPLDPNAARPLIVDIGRLDALRGISQTEETLRIGAAATYLELQRNDIIRRRAPLLIAAARDVGAIQIQARGTLGGNLATQSPAGDGVCALAAYDATIVVKSVRGERSIPFAELQTGYKRTSRAADEVIVAVEIALPRLGSPWSWRKVGARRAQAISKVALASISTVESGRATRFGVGMASVAATTATLPTLRALVLSTPLAEITDAQVNAAVDTDVHPIDDVRSTGAYRAHCARALARQLIASLRG